MNNELPRTQSEGFEVKPETTNGGKFITITDRQGNQANCTLAPTLNTASGDIVETNVLYLGNIEVSTVQRQGSGTALVKEVVEEARYRQLKFVRMDLTNPHMIDLIEKLAADCGIKDIAYLAYDDEPDSDVPSAEAFEAEDCLDPRHAKICSHLKVARDKLAEKNDDDINVGGILCVMQL